MSSSHSLRGKKPYLPYGLNRGGNKKKSNPTSNGKILSEDSVQVSVSKPCLNGTNNEAKPGEEKTVRFDGSVNSGGQFHCNTTSNNEGPPSRPKRMNNKLCPDGLDFSTIPRVLKRNNSFSTCVLQRNERRVLVLYTGGTIGMTKSDKGGLMPSPNMLEKTIRKYPHLHDVSYGNKRFGVYSESDETGDSPLVLPEISGETNRVTYTIFEYDPLLDSSQMTMDDWIHIAKDIKDHYETFDGFVVLHGTDTMAYTASALSFMMEHLGKPIIITGSQIPLFEPRSDGSHNFLDALILAANYSIPEVTVYFGNRLFRGNRTTKISADSFNAFDSPNMSPLATVGINIHVDYNSIFRPKDISCFQLHTSLSRNVGLLRLFPSITLETVQVFLQPPTQGVVLQTYGAGNFPTNRTDLIDELQKAAARGVVIVNCTQCSHGAVSAIYETGLTPKMGIIAGYDMTPEAALTKISYILGRDDLSIEEKRDLVQTNIRGELSKCPTKAAAAVSVNHKDFIFPNQNQMGKLSSQIVEGDVIHQIVTVISDNLKLTNKEEVDNIRDVIAPSLTCALVAECSSLTSLTDQQHVNAQLEALFKDSEAEITACDYSGRTTVHIAAALGDTTILKYLLKNGASVHLRDRRGYSPLKDAIEFDQHECIKILRQCGAHLTMESVALGSEICMAAGNGDITRLQSYLMAGANLNQHDPCGRTALHAAIESSKKEVVEWLLTKGNANPTIRNRLNMTPLEVAQTMGSHRIVEMLENYSNPISNEENSSSYYTLGPE